jgi:hypothetical protein
MKGTQDRVAKAGSVPSSLIVDRLRTYARTSSCATLTQTASVQRTSQNGSTLDSTSMCRSSAAAAASAGQAADDDAEEGDNGVDDCLKTSSDGVDDGHDAVADRSELLNVLVGRCAEKR